MTLEQRAGQRSAFSAKQTRRHGRGVMKLRRPSPVWAETRDCCKSGARSRWAALASPLRPDRLPYRRGRRIDGDRLAVLPLCDHEHRAVAPSVIQKLDAAAWKIF